MRATKNPEEPFLCRIGVGQRAATGRALGGEKRRLPAIDPISKSSRQPAISDETELPILFHPDSSASVGSPTVPVPMKPVEPVDFNSEVLARVSYWITTHWPRREDEAIDEPHAGLWVQDGKQHLIDRVAPQDLVFIYESKSGPAAIREYADGTTRRMPCLQGREGIVALVEVTDRAFQPEDSSPERYEDGTTLWWRYRAPTRSANSSGFLSRTEVAALLGYSERYVFRGFGDEHSGLKHVTKETFDRIRDAFIASSQADEDNRIEHASAGRFGGGGEGPEHLALKKRIAENPSTVLNEPGLRLWKEEWLLPTMDRIDLVLKDSLDRFVAVEVEVDCSATELPGPLQCMKYRAMLSYFFERPIEEVRCILAAHSIHADVHRRCGHHSIEVKVVPRPGGRLLG